MKRLAICYTSASRPNLLKKSFVSAKKYFDIKNAGLLMLHEDFFDSNKSAECIHWAKYQQVFDLIAPSNPRIGLIGAVYKMLYYSDGYQFDYVLRLCDDFVFTKHVDLPKLLNLMDNNEGINQIIFNKRPNNSFKGNFIKKEIEIDGIKLTTSPRWSSLNSIWRVDFMFKHFEECFDKIEGTSGQYNPWKAFTEHIEKEMGFKSDDIDADWIIKNLGCYLYGGIGDKNGHVNEHIGDGESVVFAHNREQF
jgi:hypothetical protein